MSHTAGLSGWQQPITVEDLYDWEKATSLLAAQEPWWEPGTASGYHAITQGYLEGEVVRRVTGQTIGEFVAKEITGPLGADFHIGTAPEHDARVAHVIPPTGAAVGRGRRSGLDRHAHARAASPLDAASVGDDPVAAGRDPGRRRARQRPLGRPGPRPDGVRRRGQRRAPAVAEGRSTPVFDEQCYGTDLVLGVVVRHGIGFGLPCPEMPISPNERACFWGGWGGSLAIIDLDARMSISYVMNKMGEGTVGDMRGAGLAPRRLHVPRPALTAPSECRIAASARPTLGWTEHSDGQAGGPGQQVVGGHRVDDLVDRHLALGGAVAAVRLPLELAGGVGVGVDREPAVVARSPGRAARAAGRAARAGS